MIDQGIDQRHPSRRSFVDESTYEGRPMAPPKRKFSEDNSEGFYNEQEHTTTENDEVMPLSPAPVRMQSSADGGKSMKQKSYLKSNYTLDDKRDRHRSSDGDHSGSAAAAAAASVGPTTAASYDRNIGSDSFDADAYADADPSSYEFNTEHKPLSCADSPERRDIEAPRPSRTSSRRKKPPHPESVYIHRQRMLAVCSFVIVGGGLAAALTYNFTKPETNEAQTVSYDDDAPCRFCYNGSTPTGLTQFTEDGITYCETFFDELTARNLSDPLCSSGQAQAWQKCGCHSPPPLPTATSTLTCTLCPNGTSPITDTAECRKYDAYVANAGLNPSLRCEDILEDAKAVCSCGAEPERVAQYREIIQPVFGSQLLDPDCAQYKALNWMAQEDESDTLSTGESSDVWQRYAVTAFCFSAAGGNWVGDLELDGEISHGVCNWGAGIVCDQQGDVIELNFENLNLEGTIPREIAFLSNLRSLNLSGNKLSSGIPNNLGENKALRVLNLAGNSLTGTIPRLLIDGQSRLNAIDLSNCLLNGSLPSDFGESSALETIRLAGNSLSGSLPASLGNRTSLRVLDLGKNRLTGPIPQFLSASTITEFRIGGNEMTGSIPYSVITLQPQLEVFDVADNGFKGNFPAFAANSGVRELIIRNNSIMGPLNALLLNLPSEALTIFEASGNQLSGTIPTSIGQFSNLNMLGLGAMGLTGTIPSEIGGLVSLESALLLNNNKLTGPVPTEIGMLTQLSGEICLENNILTGVLPSTLGLLSRLTSRLAFTNNRIEGTLPSDLGELTSLKELYGSNNLLEGIPSHIGNIWGLQFLRLSGNRIKGEIPTEIGMLSNLVELDLSQNELTGTLPAEFGTLPKLETLQVWMNGLVGTHNSLSSCPSLTGIGTFGNAFESVEELCEQSVALNVLIANFCESPVLGCSCCTHCCYQNMTCVPIIGAGRT